MADSKRLLTHSGIYAISMIMARLASFLLLPLYTHFLTPADYGILALLEVAGMYFGIAVNAGFNNALMRFYYKNGEDSNSKNVVFTTCLSVIGISGISLLVAGAPAAWWLSSKMFSTDVYGLYLVITMTGVVVDIANGTCQTLLRLQERPIAYVVMSLIRLIVGISLNIYFIAVLQIGLMGFVISGLLSALVVFLIFIPFLILRCLARPDFELAKELFRFSAPYIPKGFLDALIHNMGVICLTLTGNLAAVGIFAVGRKLGTAVSILLQPFSKVWTPYMYKISDESQATVVYARVLTYMLLVLAFVVVALSVFAKDVIRIMTSGEFAGAAAVIFPVALGSLFFSLGPSLRIGLTLSKQTRLLPLMSGIGVVVGFPITYILARDYGAVGTGWGICITWATEALATTLFSARYLRVPYRLGQLAKIMLCVFVTIFVAEKYADDSVWLRIAAVASFPFTLLLVGGFKTKDVSDLVGVFRQS